MTGPLLPLDHRWKSAVPERGVYSFTSFAGTSDIGYWFPFNYLGDWTYEGWDTLWAASPLSRADEAATDCVGFGFFLGLATRFLPYLKCKVKLVERGVE